MQGAEKCKDTKKSRVKLEQVENEADAAYPEPRLPFPCMSSLSSKEQKTYLGFLMSKKTRDPPQVPSFSPSWYFNPASPCCMASSNNLLLIFQRLKAQVNNEVMQFMRYLQDVAKICADDYNFISQGAMQYSEVLRLQGLYLSSAL